jgi:hypothetical protein
MSHLGQLRQFNDDLSHFRFSPDSHLRTDIAGVSNVQGGDIGAFSSQLWFTIERAAIRGGLFIGSRDRFSHN